MFKSLATTLLAVSVVNGQQPPCGKGFFAVVDGCGCLDQWAVPVAGEIDVCACLDSTSQWNADGSFCKIPSPEVLAQVNAVRSRYYPFDTAETRAANAKEKLAAWRAKMLQRSKEIRQAGFDVHPNPESWKGWVRNSFEGAKDWDGTIPCQADGSCKQADLIANRMILANWNAYPSSEVYNAWAGLYWNSDPIARNYWTGRPWKWEPYNQSDWYYNGQRMVPKYNLPTMVKSDGETYYRWSNYWYACPKEFCNVPWQLDAAQIKRVAAIESTHANATGMIDAAYPIDAKLESVPFSNDFSTIASSTGALNGMSRLNPQWQGTANPFNNIDPAFHGDSAKWPNNDRMPSTASSLMTNNMILPQMP